VKLFKLSAFVLGFVLLLQGVSPVSASESVQSYASDGVKNLNKYLQSKKKK